LSQDINIEQQILLEEKAIELAKKDPQAFRPLYEKYYKRIFLFILHRVESKEQSADIAAQVFLKALIKLDSYQFKGLPFSSWLFRIATNECNDFFRKNKRERLVVLEDEHAENLYEEMFGENFQDEMQQKLPHVLERLKPFELQLIELRFLEARPFKEVAEILNISEVYAKVKTYRVLEKMKKIFIKAS